MESSPMRSPLLLMVARAEQTHLGELHESGKRLAQEVAPPAPDSALALSKNPQVLTITTSAWSDFDVSSKPVAESKPSMTSASTWFLVQPRFTKPIVGFLA